MFNIPNFQILQPLYDSENSLVYRATRSVDKQPVVINGLLVYKGVGSAW